MRLKQIMDKTDRRALLKMIDNNRIIYTKNTNDGFSIFLIQIDSKAIKYKRLDEHKTRLPIKDIIFYAYLSAIWYFSWRH